MNAIIINVDTLIIECCGRLRQSHLDGSTYGLKTIFLLNLHPISITPEKLCNLFSVLNLYCLLGYMIHPKTKIVAKT